MWCEKGSDDIGVMRTSDGYGVRKTVKGMVYGGSERCGVKREVV